MRSLTFLRVIGAGAMGTVYHAELRGSRGFSRHCAVKVMKATSPDQEHFRARMRDEARLLGMLQDEQILGVTELVSVGSRDLVVMEYVEGVDLSDILVSQPVPPRALAELGAEIAGSLHRAHLAVHPSTGEPLRVVHRDVKPANVMVTSRGGVRLLDFGVARAAFASRESQTQGLVLGTLNYFPPEILAGGDPTPAVDIYGLGLTLWECATGKDWGAPQVHRKRFERRVAQRMSEIGPEYAALSGVLEQILQWEPTQRPSGADVESALLKIAEAAEGGGLRTWARDVVPPMLEKRAAVVPQKDDLVGKTFEVQDEPDLTPLGESLMDFEEAPLESQTYNDLAPPAAVARLRKDVPQSEVNTPTMAAGRDRSPPKAAGRADAPGRAEAAGGATPKRPLPPTVPKQQPAAPTAVAANRTNLLLMGVALTLVVLLLVLVVVFTLLAGLLVANLW